ncbi:MAG: MerR family transcriptional regulator [Actinomycetota bacterium]
MLDIAEVAAASGVPPSTLHVWERHGLVEPVGRAGLRRQYDDDVLDTIAVIVVCQDSGFTLTEIAELLAPDAFVGGKQLLEAKLDQLRRRRAELDAAITGLEHALACPSPHPLDCPDFCGLLEGVLPRRGAAAR